MRSGRGGEALFEQDFLDLRSCSSFVEGTRLWRGLVFTGLFKRFSENIPWVWASRVAIFATFGNLRVCWFLSWPSGCMRVCAFPFIVYSRARVAVEALADDQTESSISLRGAKRYTAEAFGPNEAPNLLSVFGLLCVGFIIFASTATKTLAVIKRLKSAAWNRLLNRLLKSARANIALRRASLGVRMHCELKELLSLPPVMAPSPRSRNPKASPLPQPCMTGIYKVPNIYSVPKCTKKLPKKTNFFPAFLNTNPQILDEKCFFPPSFF